MRVAWARAGRTDPPVLIATHYFALGPDAASGIQEYVRRHYAHLSEEGRRRIGRAISATSEARMRELFRELVDAGATEVVPIPVIARLEQVHRLADALGDLADCPRRPAN